MSSASDSLISYVRSMAATWRDDPRDDAELLTRFVEGDETAFKALVCRHGPLVWRSCARVLGNGPDTEDVFQTTFMALTRKANGLRREPLAGWLHRVARRAALDTRAAGRRRQNLEHQLHTAAQPEPANAAQAELGAALDEELARLPERLRVPLLLRYLEDKSQEEVARLLGCSRSVARKRLEQGEARLRERLERRGLTMGAASVAALLGDKAGAAVLPAGLIGSTMRSAVAFRTGNLTGVSAEAAEKLLHGLAVKGAMQKCWWVVLVCVGFLGVGGVGWVAWNMFGSGSDVVTPAVQDLPKTAEPKMVARPHDQGVDLYGDPLPEGALARIGTIRFRGVGEGFYNT